MVVTVLLWRFAKFVALLLVAGATVGAFAPAELRIRQTYVYVLGTLGLSATWLSGFGLLRASELPLSSPWIVGSILLSLGWFQTLVWIVERPDRRDVRWVGITAVLLVAIVGLMVFRPT